MIKEKKIKKNKKTDEELKGLLSDFGSVTMVGFGPRLGEIISVSNGRKTK